MESSSTSSNQGRLNQDIENFQEEQQAAEEEGRSVVVSYSCCFVAQLHILLFFCLCMFWQSWYWYLKVFEARKYNHVLLRTNLILLTRSSLSGWSCQQLQDFNKWQVMSFHPSITDITGAFYLARQFMSLLDLLIDRLDLKTPIPQLRTLPYGRRKDEKH